MCRQAEGKGREHCAKADLVNIRERWDEEEKKTKAKEKDLVCSRQLLLTYCFANNDDVWGDLLGLEGPIVRPESTQSSLYFVGDAQTAALPYQPR